MTNGTPAQTHDTLRDLVQVGAMFGLIAGVVALVLVFVWSLAMQLSSTPPAIGTTVLLHLSYVLPYVIVGIAMGVLWPVRRWLAGRVLVNVLACSLGALTVFSVGLGPVWRWPSGTWARYALASTLFAFVFTTWAPRRRQDAPQVSG